SCIRSTWFVSRGPGRFRAPLANSSRVDVFSGIHDSFRVEDALDLLHESQALAAAMGFQLGSEEGHFLGTDPMLPGHTPADPDRILADFLERGRRGFPAFRVRLVVHDGGMDVPVP